MALCGLGLLAALASAQGSSQYTTSATALTLPQGATDWTVVDTACSTTSSCVAVGDYALSDGSTRPYVAPVSSGQPGPGVGVTLPGNALQSSSQDATLSGVACQADDLCTAYGTYDDSSGDTQEMVVQISNGSPATAVEVAAPSDAVADETQLRAISCPVSGTCTAVGSYGSGTTGHTEPLIVSISGGVPATGVTASVPANSADPGGGLEDVACPAAGSCTAVGYYDGASARQLPMVVQISNGSPSAGVETLPSGATSTENSYLMVIGCPAAGACEAAGVYSNGSGIQENMVVPVTSGTPGAAIAVAPPPGYYAGLPFVTLRTMSCSSATLCVAAGQYQLTSAPTYGAALITVTGGGAAATAVSLPAGAYTGAGQSSQFDLTSPVSCAPSGPCFAAGFYMLSASSSAGMISQLSAAGQLATAQQTPLPGDATTADGNGLDFGIGCDDQGSCVSSGTYYNQSSTKTPYEVTEQAPLAITTSSVPAGAEHAPYSTTLSATGAWGVYSWSVSSGSLPPGLSLDSQTGVISGTPTRSGVSTFTVEVTGTGSPLPTASQALSITVAGGTPVVRVLPASGLVRGGRLGVKLSCAVENCDGTVKVELTKVVVVRHGKKRLRKRRIVVLGTASYAATSGQTTTVTVRLDAAGKHGLDAAKGHRLKVAIVATVTGGANCTRNEAIWTKAKKPKKH